MKTRAAIEVPKATQRPNSANINHKRDVLALYIDRAKSNKKNIDIANNIVDKRLTESLLTAFKFIYYLGEIISIGTYNTLNG